MFLDFYQMREQPFGVTPDPRYLYLGKSHREALASLFYGIEADRGFVALIAQPGLGKTTLTFQLLEKLQRAARTVFLFQTKCDSRELLHYLLNELGVDAASLDIVSMHNQLNVILAREKLAGRRFVLAIDEAQNLGPDVLETIRLLSNFETPSAKLLQILLIGQPQLACKLASPTLVQLQQRISVFARLEPFDSEETARYIAHRLQVAGYGGGPLFTPGALQIIKDQSQGIPRNINSLCFSALSLGCATGRKRIDSEIMREVVADRDVESLNKPLMTPRATSAPMRVGQTLSYPRPRSKRRLPRWALGAACMAASMAVGIVILPSSSSRIGRLLDAMTEVSASVRSAATSTESSTETTSPSGPISPLVEKVVEVPRVDPVQPSRSSGDVEVNTVVVQSGDNLRQIALRTVGRYSDRIIEQIRKLNPGMTDPNHLEVGQQVRLPRPSVTIDSPPDNGAPRSHK
jgi:type II secretory pathway predicted ATPase ExeA/phage tail protein X